MAHAPAMTAAPNAIQPTPESRSARAEGRSPPSGAAVSITPLTPPPWLLRARDADRVGRDLRLAAVERLPGRLLHRREGRLLRRIAMRRQEERALLHRVLAQRLGLRDLLGPDLVERRDHLGR